MLFMVRVSHEIHAGGERAVIIIHYAIMKIHFKKANKDTKHLHKIIKHTRTALVSDVIIIARELPRACE